MQIILDIDDKYSGITLTCIGLERGKEGSKTVFKAVSAVLDGHDGDTFVIKDSAWRTAKSAENENWTITPDDRSKQI